MPLPPPPSEQDLTVWFDHWGLVPDGDPFATQVARLAPVRWRDRPAMLKVASEAEERQGWQLMEWWDGDGAARVYAHAGDQALLLERATGAELVELARTGRDDQATRILCAVAARLHRPRPTPPPDGLLPLADWFEELWPLAETDPRLARSAEVAHRLLAGQADVVPLHGDLHHGNVLDFGSGDWRVIDPKRLIGDRGFDYANIFCNPDLDHPEPAIATRPDRFAARLHIVTELSGLSRERLLDWIIAWTGLSAAWFLGDGGDARIDWQVLGLATAARDE